MDTRVYEDYLLKILKINLAFYSYQILEKLWKTLQAENISKQISAEVHQNQNPVCWVNSVQESSLNYMPKLCVQWTKFPHHHLCTRYGYIGFFALQAKVINK